MKNQSPIFLCIETATKLCSVALIQDNEVIAEKNEKSDQYIHAESLHPFIQDVFEEAGMKPEQIDVIVVSKGPGSYTGLRIGVSATKGLAYALGKPVIAVNSLRAIAFAAAQQDSYDLIAAVIDARRDEVYYSLYDTTAQQFSNTEAVIVGDQFISRFSGRKVLIVGDASAKVSGLIPDQDNISFNPEIKHKASNLYPLALEKYKAEAFEDVAYFEPYYLKEFVAGKPKSQFKKA